MNAAGLKHNFIAVRRVAASSYGGCQTWFEDNTARDFGCGLVCGMDLLLYLSRHHGLDGVGFEPLPVEGDIPLSHYNSWCAKLRRYLPVIPGFGMSGIALATGLNAFFLVKGIPLRALWGISRDKFWQRMREMLTADIPVIMSIGPNYKRKTRTRLSLYRKFDDGSYKPTSRTQAHYVTATGLDDDWIRVSSWGRELYIKREEYSAYVLRHSSPIVSNLIYINTKT